MGSVLLRAIMRLACRFLRARHFLFEYKVLTSLSFLVLNVMI